MVQKVQIQLEDDLDGSPANETLAVSLDGRGYELHLSAANAERLRAALRPLVAAARQATSGGSRARGSIPVDIREAYHAAAGGQP